MKETTPEEVLKSMRHDNKKLDDQLNELEELEANLKKANELITSAVIRYRKEKLKKKSAKAAEEENAFYEIEDYPTRESIRDSYGYDMITEAEMDRLFYLWDLREEQAQKKNATVYRTVTENFGGINHLVQLQEILLPHLPLDASIP